MRCKWVVFFVFLFLSNIKSLQRFSALWVASNIGQAALSDIQEMINCCKIKSDWGARRDFHHKCAALNEMSHAADCRDVLFGSECIV